MTPNVGGIDRVVRIVLGLAILSLYFFVDGPNRWWALIGLVFLATGVFRVCPAYLPFGFNSSKSK